MKLIARHVQVCQVIVLRLHLDVTVREILVFLFYHVVTVDQLSIFIFKELDPLFQAMRSEIAFPVRELGHFLQLGDPVSELLVLFQEFLGEFLTLFKDLEKLFNLLGNQCGVLFHHALLVWPLR